MNYKQCTYLIFSLLLVATTGYGQLTTASGTPTALVENVLVGNGVSVSGVKYTGVSEAIGSFNGANTNLGLDKGIILTTGTISNSSTILTGQQGPFGPNDNEGSGKDNSAGGYKPLSDLIGGTSTEDAAILEFNFIPQSDTIKFRYVFGSDEYPEFVDSIFNDVFAFFISGPGIVGTRNMAQIPNGGGPVTINNLNNGWGNNGSCQNCQYYINNTNIGVGSNPATISNSFYIQYDGFTKVMEAVSPVQCGETYTLKIAIADAKDGIYDSGIFLEANSLQSSLPLEMEHTLANNHFSDKNVLAEGCERATFTVTRDSKRSASAESILLETLGTALEGVDFQSLPNTIDFVAGQRSATFSFDVLNDGITEGDETLTLRIEYPNPCGDESFISVNLILKDINPLVVTGTDKNVKCPSDEVVLDVAVSGGLPEYTYLWSTGGTASTETVSPAVTTIYSVGVTDECLGATVNEDVTVTVPVLLPLIMKTTPDTSVLCPNTPTALIAEASGGSGEYTISWYNGTNLIGRGPKYVVSPMVTTTYRVEVADGCGEVISGEIEFTVIASVLELEMSPEQIICPGDSAEIFVIATEGLGNYIYEWLHSGETTSEVIVRPNETTTYTVSVQDDCRTYSIEDQTRVKVIRPRANFNILSNLVMEGLPVSFQNTTDGGVTYWWNMGNTETSELHSPSSTYDFSGRYDVTLIAYNEIGCTDTITKSIYIRPEFYFYAPNAFTPDGNRRNNTYLVSAIGVVEFEFQIFNRWGEIIYTTNNPNFRWDGNNDGNDVLDDVYVWRAKMMDRESIYHTYNGTITVLR